MSHVNAPARVYAIETVEGQTQINAGLAFIDTPEQPKLPDGALPDGKVATGKGEMARSPSRPTVTTTASSPTRSRVGLADGSLVVIRRQQIAVSLHPQWAGGLPAGAAGLSTPGTPPQFFSAAVARKLFS